MRNLRSRKARTSVPPGTEFAKARAGGEALSQCVVSTSAREIHFHRRALEIIRGHERLRFQPAQGGNETVRDNLKSRVVKRGDLVKITARQRNPLLGVDQIPPQFGEGVLGFQLRITLL